MISLIFILLTGCFAQKHRLIYLGAVDTVDRKICNVQLDDGKIVAVESELCTKLKEGDELRVVRHASR